MSSINSISRLRLVGRNGEGEYLCIDLGAAITRIAQSKVTTRQDRIVDDFYDSSFPSSVSSVIAIQDYKVLCGREVISNIEAKNAVYNGKLLLGKESFDKELKGRLGMDYIIQECDINNKGWLKVGYAINKNQIVFFYPEYVQKLLIDTATRVVEQVIQPFNRNRLCFTIPSAWNEREIQSFHITKRLAGYDDSELVRDHVAAAYSLCQWNHNSLFSDPNETKTTDVIISIGHSYAFCILCDYRSSNRIISRDMSSGVDDKVNIRRTQGTIHRCVTTKRINGFKITNDFYDYLIEHVDDKGYRRQIETDTRTRFGLVSFLEKNKGSFCADYHTCDSLNLSKVSGMRGTYTIEGISDDEFQEILKKKYSGIVTEMLEEVVGNEKIDKICIIGGSSRPAFIRYEIKGFAEKIHSRVSEVMNGDNSIVAGGVLTCMMEELEGTEFFAVKNRCSIYDMDSKTYHNSCIPDFDRSEYEGIYKEIKEQGDNAYSLVKEINDKREERYKEYRSICEDIQLLFDEHPELSKQMRDEFNVLSRVVELKAYYSHDTYLEQQLDSLKKYKEQLWSIADIGGRGVLPFAFDFKTQ